MSELNIEHPAAFYLGHRLAEPEAKPGAPLLLEAADLTTHAVCVGMTGSGKTGLGIGLLEEAVLDGIPAIVIDPKGDLTNLLLTFPELRSADFMPWVSPDEAGRRGIALEALAEEVAKRWRDGLAGSGQGPERIARLQAAADFRIFTPGSEAGLPVSLLRTLAPPPGLDWETDAEALQERVQSAVSALLALVGIEADPVRSREHILLTHIIQDAWRAGSSISVADLIRAVQKPPMQQLGVFDLEAFYPAKERMELALTLNAIIAAPTFSAWMAGEALEPADLLWGLDGRPRVSIMTLSHLDDRERMFFITLLLEQVVAWTRAQPGSTGLRALLYFDELFGFLPPYPKSPPTKRPLLTLLKQARAVGLGLVLATQNPVDLDYKALSNAGVWLVGRLQTERDRERLIEGLMAIQSQGVPLDRGRLEQTITSLPKRAFLINNVHRPGPQLFRTRWAMSYLRGPLTRDQIRTLMAPFKAAESPAPAPAAETVPAPTAETAPAAAVTARFCSQCGAPLAAGARFCAQCGAPLAAVAAAAPAADRAAEQAFKETLRQEAAPPERPVDAYVGAPPVMAEAIPQYFLPLSGQPGPGQLAYEPVALARAVVALIDPRRGVDHRQDNLLALDPPSDAHSARWESAESLKIDADALADAPAEGALFAPVPESLNALSRIKTLEKLLSDHLYYNGGVTLLHNPKLQVFSQVGEDLADFRQRLQRAAEAERGKEVDKLTAQIRSQIDRLEDRLRRERHDLSEAEAELTGRKREEVLSAAESVLGFLGGRRPTTALSKASTKRRMTSKAKLRIEELTEQVKTFEEDLEELRQELQKSTQEVHDKWAAVAQESEEVQVRPRRTDVKIVFVGIGWRPVWRR